MDAICPRAFALLTFLVLAKLITVHAQTQNNPPTWDITSVAPLVDGISEDTLENTLLTKLICNDADGDSIEYRLLGGSAVSVDRFGNVRLRVKLDFEKPDGITYDLAFGCRDLTPIGIGKSEWVEYKVVITVNDANDIAPVFTVDSLDGYSFSVSEASSVGYVLSPPIEIVDGDRERNAQLKHLYLICNSPFPDEKVDLPASSVATCTKFSLNYTQVNEGIYTAHLVLKGGLDYESKRVYSSQIVAIDNPVNVSLQMTTTINVQINVQDAQDVDPEFTNLGELAIMVEGEAKGQNISLTISARDGDLGARRPVIIEIIDDPQDALSLYPTVECLLDPGVYCAGLRVNNSLDRESVIGNYNFVVKVTELEKVTLIKTDRTATATYSIQVADIDDNAPLFDGQEYKVLVNEVEYTNVATLLTGLRMICTDADESQNAQFSVTIVSQPFPNAYSISPGVNFTGTAVLFLNVNKMEYLDYDVASYRQQTLVLKAESLDKKFSSSATVSITLLDINDNVPIFTNAPYEYFVSEDIRISEMPYSIANITATDIDSGKNGEISFSLGGGSNKFEIKPSTGELLLISEVDYETSPIYVFLVYAKDGSPSSESSQAQVTVKVRNVNDQRPVFKQPLYLTSVDELQTQFRLPIVVFARDDEDGSGNITYSIRDGQTDDNAFVLDPNTGALTLQRTLPYRGDGIYELIVAASDSGIPAMTGTATVRVTVIDENNYAPVFSPKQYAATISETIAPGTSIATISGTDQDEGNFGTITFRIVSGGSDNFEIDASTGEVSIRNPQNFDYNEQQSYTVQIIGSDGGAPQLTDSAILIVTITDANNKNPEFTKDIYTETVNETVPIGTSILRVSAEDSDSTSRLEYEIQRSTMIGRNGDGNLIINPADNFRDSVEINNITGVVSVKSQLNKERLLTLTFAVQVQDKGADPAQFATSSVAITFTGPPNTDLSFDPMQTIFINEDSTVGYDITTVVARDPTNELGQINYLVDGSSPYFAIDGTTGIVSLRSQIDYDNDTMLDHTYTLPIKAVAPDNIRSVSMTLTMKVTDDNDNKPKFAKPEYIATVDEDAYPLTFVTNIVATDEDTSSYGPVEYRISGGLDSEHFQLYKAFLGVDVLVAANTTLNFNTREYYELDIFAFDNPSKRYSNVQQFSSVKLKISVIDKNNHFPVFLDGNSARKFGVAELDAVNTVVGKVLATDDDSGVNGEITYLLESVDDTLGWTLFDVNSRSGEISVIKSLLGYGDKIFYFRVKAEDGGQSPRVSTLNVTIQVLRTESNDGNPQWIFPASNHVFRVPEETKDVVVTDRLEAIPKTGNSVVYKLSPLSDIFDSLDIDLTTGRITLKNPLDREEKEKYKILVYAEDTQDPEFRTGREIIIELDDIDDNKPVFSKPQACGEPIGKALEMSFYESAPKNHFIYTLSACDTDKIYSRIYYCLYDGDQNEIQYCKDENNKAKPYIDVMDNGTIALKENVDYSDKQNFKLCVKAGNVPCSQAIRKKRSFDMSKIVVVENDVAYIFIRVIDENNKAPVFPKDHVVAAVKSDVGDVPVLVFDAKDEDGPNYNSIIYSIQDSTFYDEDGLTQYSVSRAFVIENNQLFPNVARGKTLESFSGGRFKLLIRATDASDSSKYDTQLVTLYIYEDNEALKIILNVSPDNGIKTGKQIVSDLNGVSDNTEFLYLHVAVNNDGDSIHNSKTDVCFIAVGTESDRLLNVYDLTQILDSSSYKNVLGDNGVIGRGRCYPSSSSEDKITWKDLWWVLVVVAIFIGVCCLIFMLIICVLYNRYKNYIKTKRTYLVPQ